MNRCVERKKYEDFAHNPVSLKWISWFSVRELMYPPWLCSIMFCFEVWYTVAIYSKPRSLVPDLCTLQSDYVIRLPWYFDLWVCWLRGELLQQHFDKQIRYWRETELPYTYTASYKDQVCLALRYHEWDSCLRFQIFKQTRWCKRI